MRRAGRARRLGYEERPDEEVVVGQLDDPELVVGVGAAHHEPGGEEHHAVVGIHAEVAVVALRGLDRAVCTIRAVPGSMRTSITWPRSEQASSLMTGSLVSG